MLPEPIGVAHQLWNHIDGDVERDFGNPGFATVRFGRG